MEFGFFVFLVLNEYLHYIDFIDHKEIKLYGLALLITYTHLLKIYNESTRSN